MKRAAVIGFLAVFLAVGSVTILAAQDGENASQGETTIEELYLQQQQKIQVMKALAYNDEHNRETMLNALKYAESMVDEARSSNAIETLQNNEEVIDTLDSLGREGTSNVTYKNGIRINNFPTVRRDACRILGEVGGEKAKESLMNILRQENNSMVMSEAIYALAKVETEEESQEIMNSIAATMRTQIHTDQDANFASTALLALERISDRHDGIDNQEVIKLITLLSQPSSGYPRAIRLQAQALTDKMMAY